MAIIIPKFNENEIKQLNIAQEFSRFASNYDRVNSIQKEVALDLISRLHSSKYAQIIDLGCGSGEIYKNLIQKKIDFNHFTGVDLSQKMLDLHPQESRVELIQSDFSVLALNQSYDLVISASALQWSQDLNKTFANISKLSQKFYFAIFTANTFKTLHQTANITSPIYKTQELQKSINQYFYATYRLNQYKLYFNSTHEMLRYIKGSGVSGGHKRLSYKETKTLMQNYPLDYLEFEVLFVEACKK
jgi:malonyl-CoA O-methyltransferase